MPLYYSNFKSFSNKISRIFLFEQLFCMAFISYTERPISALSLAGEARAGLIWVEFNFVMSQQAPIQWSLNSWAAQANHGHPSVHLPQIAKKSHAIWLDKETKGPMVKKETCVNWSVK